MVGPVVRGVPVVCVCAAGRLSTILVHSLRGGILLVLTGVEMGWEGWSGGIRDGSEGDWGGLEKGCRG